MRDKWFNKSNTCLNIYVLQVVHTVFEPQVSGFNYDQAKDKWLSYLMLIQQHPTHETQPAGMYVPSLLCLASSADTPTPHAGT